MGEPDGSVLTAVEFSPVRKYGGLSTVAASARPPVEMTRVMGGLEDSAFGRDDERVMGALDGLAFGRDDKSYG